MEFLNKFKKGQSLPLNTIVIAILVIIVLLVIIVFFTTQVGNTGDQLDANNPSQCNENNPALSTLGYVDFVSNTTYINLDDNIKSDFSKVIGVSNCYASRTDQGKTYTK